MNDVPDGSPSWGIYLVEYLEDNWKGLPEATREFCKQQWIKRAEPLANVQFVVLRLLPDELFPMHGHEKPYIEWRHPIERGPKCGYTVQGHVEVKLESALDTMEDTVDPVLRARIESDLRDKYPKNTPYIIYGRETRYLATGRL